MLKGLKPLQTLLSYRPLKSFLTKNPKANTPSITFSPINRAPPHLKPLSAKETDFKTILYHYSRLLTQKETSQALESLFHTIKSFGSNWLFQQTPSDQVSLLFNLARSVRSLETSFAKEITVYVETLLKEIVNRDSNLLSIEDYSKLLFISHHLEFLNQNLINSFITAFPLKQAEVTGTKVFSPLYNLSKLYALLERSSFMKKNVSCEGQMTVIRDFFCKSPEVKQRIKQALLSGKATQWNVTNLAWAFSRVNHDSVDLWQLIIDYIALNYKALSDQAFKTSIVAITSQNKVTNLYLLTQFKSHFDSRLQEDFDNISVDYFIRCFRAFLQQNSSIINNEDFSLPLYERFINEKRGLFQLSQNITLIYCFAIMNYKNRGLIEETINLVLPHLTDSYMKANENVSLLFWAGGILLTENKAFWEAFQRSLTFMDFQFMNPRHLVNLVLPLEVLLLYRSNYINQTLLNLHETQTNIMTLAFEKVFKKSSSEIHMKAFKGFDLFLTCKASGIEIQPEILLDFYPVDYYIPDFLSIDFDQKLESLSSIALKYNQMYPGEGKPIFERVCTFKDLKSIEAFVKATKGDSLAVEIQGMTHYIIEERFEKGAGVMKQKILRDKGFNLMTLGFSKCFEIGNVPSLEGRIQRVLEMFKQMQIEIKQKPNNKE